MASERAWETTKRWLRQFQEKLASLEEIKGTMHPVQYQAHREAIESQIKSLEAELKDIDSNSEAS